MSKKDNRSNKNGENEINDNNQLNNAYSNNQNFLNNNINNNIGNNKSNNKEKSNGNEDEIANDVDENISIENKTILINKNKNYVKNNNINNNAPNNGHIKGISHNNNNYIQNHPKNIINNINDKNIANKINDKNNIQNKNLGNEKQINKINELNNINNKIINKSVLEKKEEKEKILDNYLCFICKGKAYIKLNQTKFTVDMKCSKGHTQANIPIKEFISKNEFNKKKYCQECVKGRINIEELYYCNCNKTICQKCKNEKKHKNHTQIKLCQQYNLCLKHKNEYKCFCLQCNKNICYECFNDHNSHLEFILIFDNYLPKEKEISKNKYNLDKAKDYKYEFDIKFDQFIETLKNKKREYDKNFEEFIKIQNNIINRIDSKESLSYEDIDNYSNLKSIDNDKDKIFDFLKTYELAQEGKLLIDILERDHSEKNNNDNNINNYNNRNNQNNIYKNNNIYGDKNQLKSYKDQNRIFERNNKTNNYNYSYYNNYKNEIKKKVLDKIEDCTQIINKKESKCITCFAILRNNRIVISFKSGILKFYEFEKIRQDKFEMKEILCLEEEEYCFNYCIELYNGDVAVASEDSTLKIIKLFFDEDTNNNEKYKIIQNIEEKNIYPIYIIKELANKNLVLGCWRNILVYQKANDYELINRLIIDDYTFALLELSPNVIISAHSTTNTLTIHNLNNYEIETIENIESNENNNIICKYNDQNDIVFVGFNRGINIVSIIKKCLIKKISLFDTIITGLCPMMFNYDLGNGKKEKIFGLLCGEKEKIYRQHINYTYNLVQIGFNLNDKERGVIDPNDKRYVFDEIICKKELIHHYDITNIQNSLFFKNNNTLKLLNNKDEQWIFTSGSEDRTLNIWKL